MIKAGLINIGNELLLGETVNTNMSCIGKVLAEEGIYLNKSLIIRDEEEEILKALKLFCKEGYDIIISTGGLGPTSDDITRVSIAKFFKKKLIFNEKIWGQLKKLFKEKKNMIIPDSNKSQAMIPEDFKLLKNLYGTADGLFYEFSKTKFFALPGVPAEMKYLIAKQVIPLIRKSFDSAKISQKNIHTCHLTESGLAEKLADINIPEGIELAFLPQRSYVNLRIYGNDLKKIEIVSEEIQRRIGKFIWAEDVSSPAEKVHADFKERGLKLALAESCTGGLAGKALTHFSGASEYFLSSLVTYSNEMKQKFLNVQRKTLEKQGAVSRETALEMASGVRIAAGSDIGASITGIAGPGGGTTEKPVGTVYIAVVSDKKNNAELLKLKGDRESIRQQSVDRLFILITKFLREEQK